MKHYNKYNILLRKCELKQEIQKNRKKNTIYNTKFLKNGKRKKKIIDDKNNKMMKK